MTARLGWLLLAALVGCGSGKDGGRAKGSGAAKAPSGMDARGAARPGAARRRRPERKCPMPSPEVGVPDPPGAKSAHEVLPKWARTAKVTNKLVVRRAPSREAPAEGEIKKYSRLPLRAIVPGKDGCHKYWMRVAPRGWVCGDYLRPDRREVLMRPQPIMRKGRILPGRYAWVRRGGAPKFPNRQAALDNKPAGTIASGFIVRWKKNVTLRGELFWVNSKNYLVPASRLLRHHPSRYGGADLRALGYDLPVAIVRAKTRGATVFDAPGGHEIGRVKHHSVHEIFEAKRDGRTKYYRIGPGRWILARRVISAWPTRPPPGIKPCEKWIEIIIEQQSLVAWEGTEPVYATMISSGDKKHPTKYGIFRIWWKKAQTDMTSSMAGSELYRVDDVPWAQYFYLGQALHGAYWHSDWGNRKSHGCVNLAPRDAKWLYDWTIPHVPDGWISRYADEHFPGTIVRVRHKVDHQVPFLRYARKLAPPEAVKRLDEAYKERMRKKTLRLLETKRIVPRASGGHPPKER